MGMMCLGLFVFELKSAPFQSLQQQTGWRHPSNARVGLRPARQFVGPDDESITLSGVLLPPLTGGKANIAALRTMADSGKAFVLMDGNGIMYGLYVIESIDQTMTEFFADGTPRKVEFSLALKRVDDDGVEIGGDDPDYDNEGVGV
ncbi:MAG: phage tail protein [Azoarcus sp.]|jgi:phage protein U|nr:phage tail protein [Azoarcus sp.]